ncbi:ATP-binding protein [Kitasatospora sp. NPDC056181]|uniref:ATP-binding protein n=1 Tax=Kitasatospora sp. NPDC056181 TaxID=3345737 RepID=UPI0035D9A3B6
MCNCTLNSPSLALAREALRAAMARAGWDFESIADAELALAELIVNAWRHGRTTSPVVLVLILGRTLRVSVSDASTDFRTLRVRGVRARPPAGPGPHPPLGDRAAEARQVRLVRAGRRRVNHTSAQARRPPCSVS